MARHVKACWGSGCPFPLPAQQQNHALWWNDVLRNLTMDDHGTYNLVIRFCSPRIVRLAAWSVSGGRLTVKRLQLFKYTKITDLSTALCALCMLFSQIRKLLGPLQCYVVSPPHNTTCSENKVFSQRSLHVGTPRRSRCLFPVECEWSHATKWHSPVALNAPFAVC